MEELKVNNRKPFVDIIDCVFNYLTSAKYPPNWSRDQKKELRRRSNAFTIIDGTLFYQGHKKDRNARVVSSRDEQLRIVKACHEGIGETMQSKAMSGHLGRDKTQARIIERFYWPTITNDVQEFLKTCDTCQRTNKVFKKTVSEMQSIPIKNEPFHRIGIDLIGPLPETKEGYRYIVSSTCAFTKWVESEPLQEKSATAVANFLYRLICRHGCFNIQLSDQGREFVNSVSAELHRLTGVDHRITTAYHPQCNGLAEKQNQTTQAILLKYLENQNDWADILDSVLFAYRTSKHASTGYSPFFLLYNRQPRLPVEVMVENESPNTTDDLEDTTPVESSMDDPQLQQWKT